MSEIESQTPEIVAVFDQSESSQEQTRTYIFLKEKIEEGLLSVESIHSTQQLGKITPEQAEELIGLIQTRTYNFLKEKIGEGLLNVESIHSTQQLGKITPEQAEELIGLINERNQS